MVVDVQFHVVYDPKTWPGQRYGEWMAEDRDEVKETCRPAIGADQPHIWGVDRTT